MVSELGQPCSSQQRYRRTEAGKRLLEEDT